MEKKKTSEKAATGGQAKKGVVIYPGINIREVETLLAYRNQRKNKD